MSSVIADRRGKPRYPVHTRFFASIDGQAVILNNIGLSGVAMRAHGLTVGSSHLLEIHLERRHIALTVEILDASDGQLLHARFVDLPDEAHRVIDKYISDCR